MIPSEAGRFDMAWVCAAKIVGGVAQQNKMSMEVKSQTSSSLVTLLRQPH